MLKPNKNFIFSSSYYSWREGGGGGGGGGVELAQEILLMFEDFHDAQF